MEHRPLTIFQKKPISVSIESGNTEFKKATKHSEAVRNIRQMGPGYLMQLQGSVKAMKTDGKSPPRI